MNFKNKLKKKLPVQFLAPAQKVRQSFQLKTTLAYQVSEASRVRLCIYDLLGRHIETLVDATLEPGAYTTLFDGQMLVGGTYLCRLETNEGIETREMTLLK